MNIIFFDLDGTLEDSRKDMVDAANRTRAHFKLMPKPHEVLAPCVSKGMEYLYRTALCELFPGDDVNAPMESKFAPVLNDVRGIYEADYLSHVAVDTKLYPDMKNALTQLAKVAQLVVVTNKPEKISKALLKKLDIDTHFKAVMGCDSCPEGKPSALPAQTAATKLKFNPLKGKSFVVGDSAADMQMAVNFGATSVWCSWGYLKSPPEPYPSYVARSANHMAEIILKELGVNNSH